MPKELEDCIAYISEHTGISFNSQSKISQIILERMNELGLSSPKYYLMYLKDNSRNLNTKLREIIPLITVGETYFFRDIDQLKSVIEYIRVLIVSEKRKHLRLWSVGCSTGEEAYSLAILLEELKKLDINFEYSVLATDINESFLKIAQKGLYFGRSVKFVKQRQLNAYFSSEDECYRVKRKIRERITFLVFNLVTEPTYSLGQNFNKFDVILCRNVLIYFHQEAIEQTIAKLASTLDEKGALFLGHSEGFQTVRKMLKMIRVKDNFCYVKSFEDTMITETFETDKSSDKAAREKPTMCIVGYVAEDTNLRLLNPSAPKNIKSLKETEKKSDFDEKKLFPKSASSESKGTLEKARKLYDSGKYKQAKDICQEITEKQPLNEDVYRLLYHIQLACGEYFSAQKSIKKLIYVNPKDVISRYHLARTLLKAGNKKDSLREYRVILSAIHDKDREEIIPESDGLTYGMLKKLCVAALGKEAKW